MLQRCCDKFKSTHSENTSSNKTQALRKCMGILDIWVVGVLNKLFKKGFYADTKFSNKNKVVRGKASFYVISLLCACYFICLNVAFF